MIGEEQVVTRLALAVLLGALVGAERERAERAAGLRTHALVGVGSCLFMLVSAFGFADILGTPHVDLDPSRVAAQVASGIGFLGAGTIFLRRDTVRGLTTAASVWAVAAIGLAIGGGLYLAGVSATLLTLGVLAALKPIEQRVFVHRRPPLLSLIIDRPGASLLPIESTVEAAGLVLERLHVQPDGPQQHRVEIVLNRIPQEGLAALVDSLTHIDGVRTVKMKRPRPTRTFGGRGTTGSGG